MTEALLVTDAARLGARRAVTPQRHDTVYWARECVALSFLLQCWARGAALRSARDDLTLARLKAASAVLRAFAPAAPFRNCAVGRACLQVAPHVVFELGARLATVLRSLCDRALTALLSGTTRARACRAILEVRDLAVDGTVNKRAPEVLGEGAAASTTVGRRRHNRAVACLARRATRAIARTPGTPTAVLAIAWTRLRVALLRLGEEGTGLAAVCSG